MVGRAQPAFASLLIFSHADAQLGREPVVALWLAAGFAALGGVFSMLRWWHTPAAQ